MSNIKSTGEDTPRSVEIADFKFSRIALVGSPNSGKSTLFNALTGLHVKVANYPGVTVERVEGKLFLPDNKQLEIIDLPGTYSLNPLSPEEQLALDVLRGEVEDCAEPDGIIFVTDSTSLPRTLPMLAALLRLNKPVIMVLTMIDELKVRHGRLDPDALSRRLGIPVLGIVGNRGTGIDDLKLLLANPAGIDTSGLTQLIPESIEERFSWADQMLKGVYEAPQRATPTTEFLDRILLHPVFGILIFAFVMVFFFQAIFLWASPLQEGLESAVSAGGKFLQQSLAPGMLRSILVDGIIAGVGSVVVFIPQIALLFLLLSLLEQSGYMSRAVFLIDRMMGWVGLDGRSFIALLSSYACAIPGMMATRNIPDPRNRITTILIAPFMTCSARLPVYTVLIAAFIPSRSILYVFNLQGLVMLGLYLVGALSAFLVANILRRGLMSGRTLPFYIELPSYRWPTFGLLLRNILEPVVRFLKRAGTVILAAAIVLWFLLNFPNTPIPPEVQKAGKMAESNYRIDHSYAAMIGKQIEPVIAPLGFDWRIGIGLIASLAAREVLITTMAQVYSVKADEDEERRKLSQYLSRELKPPGYQGDNFIYSLAVALALLAFFVYALQCVSTLAVMRRETGQWKWPIFAFVGMLALAYLAAFVVFRVTILFA